jgi:F1F0 ATPase subunit 2
MINALIAIPYSPLQLCVYLSSGFALGSAFYLSLWWAVFKGVTSARPALWFVASFFIRVSLCLVGFYFITDGNWASLVFSLFGFIVARPVSKLLIELTSKGTPTKARIKNAT